MKPRRRGFLRRMLDVCLKTGGKPKRTAAVWPVKGYVRVLRGHASLHLTKSGRQFNRILRQRRRVGANINLE